jgi:uncharacterized membrane protein YeiB
MGVILHLSVWPTEILVPFALMMPLAVLIRHAARSAVPGVAAIILILALAIPMFFSEAVGADWNDDGSHVADSALGWGTLRLLLMDGNYPIIPWLAFGLIGMTLVECARGAAHRYEALFAWAIAVYLVSQSWVFWAGAHADALGPLAPYATSTWTPTSIPFVLVTGSFALMVIGAVGWRQAHRGSGQVMSVLACFGRASLTHYLAHITLVYVPMKAILRSDGWSAGTGVLACAGYLLIAMPLSVLWFRRFSRGPIEYLWHRASG